MNSVVNKTVISFACIVSAVEEGRHVFDNILKFIVYLLSCNGAEIFLNLICAAAGMELPFGTVLILWANIIGKAIFEHRWSLDGLKLY
jgi:magnesium-transporting ATPase (P-type)